MKRCIIFSYGPVPAPEHDKVEGGGLRCWGLAKGLREHDQDTEITVAYHESYAKPNPTTEFENIKLASWNIGAIEQLISGYDTVVVSYCMGDLSVEIASKIQANQQLILDCYVPIYVEISARGSQDVEREYYAFRTEVSRWSHVLLRGDVFLCASPSQKRYYQGVLSALGRINPATYDDDLLLVVPYGVYKEKPKVKAKPISAMLQAEKAQDAKRILWFGAVYPWFDLKTLVDAVDKVNESIHAKLIIVGAKNPFNAHPDFIKRYEELLEYVDNNPTKKQHILFQDWVDFNDRADWYLDSDLVILINKIGNENELAWRTRLVDYIWADLPILTNGGDPLGEELIGAGAAAHLPDLSVEGLTSSMTDLLTKPKKLDDLKANLSAVRKNYYWGTVTQELHQKIADHARPTDFTRFGLLDVDHSNMPQGRSARLMRKAKKVPNYYRKYGARNTYAAVRTAAGRRLKRAPLRTEPRVIFLSHQLDTTGAPHVFVDTVKDFREVYPGVPVEFHTFNPADRENIRALNSAGVKPLLHVSRDIRLPFVAGDVVVLNTVAFSDIVRGSVYEALEKGVVKKLIWYVHEDEPEYIFDKSETARIQKLMERGLITIFAAAIKTRQHYTEHFGQADHIKDQGYRVSVPSKHSKVRQAGDFERLDFILPGMVGDGRKGQLPILYAFIEFKKRFFDKSPEDYRDFSLTYIGVGKDFLSRQLLKHTDAGLGRRFKHYGAMPHATCLDYMLRANVTVCYSLRECLPMFVYEGMAAGHPLLRNDSSGQEEQLVINKNGYYLDSNDFDQVVQTIEKICNKNKTSSELLADMSKLSNEIAVKLKDNKFDTITQSIIKAYESQD